MRQQSEVVALSFQCSIHARSLGGASWKINQLPNHSSNIMFKKYRSSFKDLYLKEIVSATTLLVC